MRDKAGKKLSYVARLAFAEGELVEQWCDAMEKATVILAQYEFMQRGDMFPVCEGIAAAIDEQVQKVRELLPAYRCPKCHRKPVNNHCICEGERWITNDQYVLLMNQRHPEERSRKQLLELQKRSDSTPSSPPKKKSLPRFEGRRFHRGSH